MHECSQQQFRTGENFHSNTSIDNRELHKLEFHQNRIAPPCSPLKQHQLYGQWVQQRITSSDFLSHPWLHFLRHPSDPYRGSCLCAGQAQPLAPMVYRKPMAQTAVISETYGHNQHLQRVFWGFFGFNVSLLLSTVGCSSFIFTPAHELFQVSSSFPVTQRVCSYFLSLSSLFWEQRKCHAWNPVTEAEVHQHFHWEHAQTAFPERGKSAQKCSREFHFGASSAVLFKPKHLTLTSCIC